MTEVWHLEAGRATLRAAGCSAALDLASPERGLQSVEQNGTLVADSLLGIGLDTQPLRLADCFVRGDDLVCRYDTEEGRTHLTAYWRVGQNGDGSVIAIDLVASVSTDVLETFPDLRSTSAYRESNGLVWKAADSGDRAVIVNGFGWSAAEMPLEGLHAEPSLEEDRSTVSWLLASGFMEKGVIRRAVLRCRLQREPIEPGDGQVAGWLDELRAPGPPLSA